MSMSMALRRDKGSGTIYFNNATQKWFASCPIGVYANSLEKVSPGNAYILPEPQTVTIPGDDIAYATAKNVWKHWWATITKVDS